MAAHTPLPATVEDFAAPALATAVVSPAAGMAEAAITAGAAITAAIPIVVTMDRAITAPVVVPTLGPPFWAASLGPLGPLSDAIESVGFR